MADPTFTVTGDPRFQPPPAVFATQAGNVSTKAGFRQFEWNCKVTMSGTTQSAFEVGFLQTLLQHNIQLTYGSAAQPNGAVVVATPIRDSEIVNVVWKDDHPLGILGSFKFNLPDPNFPDFLKDTQFNSEASLSTGDDPGGPVAFMEPIAPNAPGGPAQSLRTISIDQQFCTWVAVRAQAKPANAESSYTFLKHVVWVVQRTIRVLPVGAGFFAFFERNATRSTDFGNGRGSARPQLGQAIANQSVRLQARGAVVPGSIAATIR